MKNSKIKLSVLIVLVLCMVVSFAMPIMTSATETSEKERIVADLKGIRDYVAGTASTPVAPGAKGDLAPANQQAFGLSLDKAVDILLTNYEADPSEANLLDITKFLKTWMWGGHDADKIFLTDKLFGYFYDFVRFIEEKDIKDPEKPDELAFTWPMALKDKDDENSGYLYTFAKRFVTNTDTYKEFYANSKIGEEKGVNGLFEHFMAIDSSLYVSGRDVKAVSAKAEETKAAMCAAPTAKDAYAALTAFFDYLNEDGHMVLKTASEMYRTLAKLNYIVENINDGDADALGALKEYQEFLPEELASMDQFNMPKYPLSAIIQYRPAGQADSFKEDAKAYSDAFRLLNEDTVAVMEEYAATVSDFDARMAGFTYNDPYAPINNGGNGGGNGGNNNGGNSNKPDNTADALTAFLAVTAIVSAGCVVALVRAKRSYNR